MKRVTMLNILFAAILGSSMVSAMELETKEAASQKSARAERAKRYAERARNREAEDAESKAVESAAVEKEAKESKEPREPKEEKRSEREERLDRRNKEKEATHTVEEKEEEKESKKHRRDEKEEKDEHQENDGESKTLSAREERSHNRQIKKQRNSSEAGSVTAEPIEEENEEEEEPAEEEKGESKEGKEEKEEKGEEKRSGPASEPGYIASVNEKAMMENIKRTSCKWTLTSYFFGAALYNFLAAFKLLIEKGVDVTYQNKGEDRMTALHNAAQSGNVKIIEALLTAVRTSGGDVTTYVNLQNWHTRTALHVAAHYGDIDSMRALLEAVRASGGDVTACVNLQDVFQWTPLLSAARYGHTECVEALLAAVRASDGDVIAYLNLKDALQMTALHRAADHGYAACTKALICAGAATDLGKDANPANQAFVYKCVEELNQEIGTCNASRRGPICQDIKTQTPLPKELIALISQYSEDCLISVGDEKSEEPAEDDNASGPSWDVYTEPLRDTKEEKEGKSSDQKDSEYAGECFICNKNIAKKHAKNLPCGHIFHTTCIDEWFNNFSKKCPQEDCENTRRAVTPGSIGHSTAATSTPSRSSSTTEAPQPIQPITTLTASSVQTSTSIPITDLTTPPAPVQTSTGVLITILTTPPALPTTIPAPTEMPATPMPRHPFSLDFGVQARFHDNRPTNWGNWSARTSSTDGTDEKNNDGPTDMDPTE